MNKEIIEFNKAVIDRDKEICAKLATIIDQELPEAESKIWHGSPVWFLAGNPVAGYSSLKDSVQLLFWSGQSFDEPNLQSEGSFKAAQVRYKNIEEINESDLRRWLKKAKKIQWDYKNIVKRKGELVRL